MFTKDHKNNKGMKYALKAKSSKNLKHFRSSSST